MNVTIAFHRQFLKDAKRLLKKYRSLTDDLQCFVAELKENPDMGVDLGAGVRKVRLSIASKGKGKSGGARVITFRRIQDSEGTVRILLLTMYDKNEIANVSDTFIRSLIADVKNEDLKK